MRRVFNLIFIFLAVFVFVSCDEEQVTEFVKEKVSREVSTEEGGTISTSDGMISMTVPADALASDTQITMTVYETTEYTTEDGEERISQIVECEPSGTIFKKPVIITLNATRDIKNKIITAAVYNTEKEEWSYSPTGAAVKISGKDEAGDPIMTTAAGDPIMLNAAGDPIMMSAAGDPIMLSAAGDPIMVTAAGDPIMNAAAGDPIMMTTGHFTAFTFIALGDDELLDSGDEGEEDDDADAEPYVPECGNGVLDEGEACDNGENNSDEPGIPGVTCRKNCILAKCGDSIADTDEACDDGNTEDGDYCSADCQAVTGSCGDGKIQNNEVCDKAKPDEGEGEGTGVYCSEDCSEITGGCGDGVVQENEECDLGENGEYYNGKTTCDYGETSCSVCTEECKKADGVPSYCGDGITDIEHEEECDNAADNGKTDCAYGETVCSRCTTGCRITSGKVSYCGDGVKQDNEICDDGNTADGDYCSADCQTVAGSCGDGIKQTNEACDDGNTAEGDYCSADCQTVTGSCGDGIKQTGEACDNGSDNGRTACAYGETSCTVCTTSCQVAAGATSYCGDGIKDVLNNEKCDNGSDNGRTACAYGETSCTVCTTSCQVLSGQTSYCGDGNVDEANGEACDNGSGNGKTNCAYGETGCSVCTTSCQFTAGQTSYCGDGVTDSINGEACDNGSDNGKTDCTYGETGCSLCTTGCKKTSGRVSYCGDGRTDAENGENCDDGNNADGDYCSADCQTVTGSCGDGKIQSGEVCDKADPEVGDGEGTGAYCSDDCTEIIGSCGDGIINRTDCEGLENCVETAGLDEECDFGVIEEGYGALFSGVSGIFNGNTACFYGETSCSVCTTDCRLASGSTSYCGDGNVDGENGEECDNASGNGATNCPYGETSCTVCTNQCRRLAGATSYCGDGRIDAENNETCDEGSLNGTYGHCDAMCGGVSSRCGDGEINTENGESCDDGELNGTYGHCNTTCSGRASYCGDGHIDEDNEACDNGTDNGRTNCAYGETSCTVCTTECQENQGVTSYCGDGLTDTANGEACDNASDNGRTDCAYGEESCLVCTAQCKQIHGAASYCGDGRVDSANNETCDEGTLNGTYGHCNSTCIGRASYCGDGEVNAENNETCDDGGLNGTYGHCNSTCSGRASYCGDGVTDTANGEACDNGSDNGRTNCAYGQTSCSVCTTECQPAQGVASYCGDGLTDTANGEACDNASDNGRTNCAYGEESCLVCTAQCKEIPGAASLCGDGKIDAGNNEICDKGFANGETNCAYGETLCTVCTTECQENQGVTSYCGDGVTDSANNETCDNGAGNGATSCAYGETECLVCSTQCRQVPGVTSYCGDGRIDAENNETCDEGSNLNGTYGHCNATCSASSSSCGDGEINAENGESCDDGEANGTYGHCNSTCNGRAPFCGDGHIDDNEACDNGTDNGRTNCAYGETACSVCTTECQENQGVASYCGDGNVDEANGEACDNGSDNGRTNCAYGEESCLVCSYQCKEIPGAASYCGDGRIDAGNNEICDEGTLNGTYGHCNSTCSGGASRCGDGNIDTANGEICDDGEANGAYNHCNATCSGRASYCGDGQIDEDNEACDNGTDNGATNCAYGQAECTVCTTECRPAQGVASYCGDGNVDEANGEACDNGGDNGETNCAYGEESCLVCTDQCKQIQGATSLCGDGRVDAEHDESCDDGTLNGTYGHCNTTCSGRAPFCGDGQINEDNETCDDGEANGTYGHCNATCSGAASRCGDGRIDTENGEVCDNGSANGATNCTYGEEECTVCTTECQENPGVASFCGDGNVDQSNSEICDRGIENGTTDCTYGETACTVCTDYCRQIPGATSYCGDGRIDEDNETCDNGPANGRTNCAYGEEECTVCTSECQENPGAASFCGDGNVDEANGEECDNASDNGATSCAYGQTACTVCTTQCRNSAGSASYCGDGRIDSENNESCDDGTLNGTYGHCNSTCNGQASYCGDGEIDTENGETCDDGELNGAYGHCNTACSGQAAHCGDGNVDEANGEICDNGAENGRTNCAYGEEECTVCTTECQENPGIASYCGDGGTDTANGEVCDNGADNGATNCLYGETQCMVCVNQCREQIPGAASYCGDGRIDEEHESCDNGVNNGATNCAYGETECSLCTTGCQPSQGATSYCGDGNVDSANKEECDNGSDNGATNCTYGATSCMLCTTGCKRTAGATSYCGDGIVDTENGETCDEGANLNGTYGHCNSSCNGPASYCGDGNVDEANGETCDEGTELNGSYGHCNSTCSGQAAHCGDGQIDEDHETCDNGVDNGATNCAYGQTACTLCTTECQETQGATSYCGDSVTDAANGEICDNGGDNGRTNCAYGAESCTVCTTGCKQIAGATSYCGDGRIDEDHEACDRGFANGLSNCAYGELECTVCTADCHEDDGETSYCGDGSIDTANGEVCDNGADNGATDCEYGQENCLICTDQCRKASGVTSYCGDGMVDTENGETCDEGVIINGLYGHCNTECDGMASYCGDGIVDGENGESCDDGELNGTYGNCNTTCSGRASFCGDGQIDEDHEACDNGADNGRTNCSYGEEECTVCTADCHEDNGETSYCGDGVVDAVNGEDCDNGEDNGETDCAYGEESCTVCSIGCQSVQGSTSYCGDGRIDAENEEVCDKADPSVGDGEGTGARCSDDCTEILSVNSGATVICTGQTRCGDAEGSLIDCPLEGEELYGQDAHYTARGSCIPQSYEKVTVGDYEVVDDLNTGLRWYISPNGGTWEQAVTYCGNLDMSDDRTWRLPTAKELITILDGDASYPALRTAYFTVHESYNAYWSSTYFANNKTGSDEVLIMDVGYGHLQYAAEGKEGINSFACVSGDEYGAAGTFTTSTVSDVSVVTDSATNLMWQPEASTSRTWTEAIEYCENLEYAGFDDWRVPNRNELATLLDHSLIAQTGLASSFPNIGGSNFWTSTYAPTYGGTNGAFIIEMMGGTMMGSLEIEQNYRASVLCVRSGELEEYQAVITCNETGFAPCQDEETGIVWSPNINTNYYSAGVAQIAQMCRESTNGGISQWRAPTIDELRTILVNSTDLYTGGACKVSDECSDIGDEVCYDSEICETGEKFESIFHDATFISSGTPTEELNGEEISSVWFVNFGNGAIESYDGYELYPLPVIRCVKDESLPDIQFPYTDTESGLFWSSISREEFLKTGADDYCGSLNEGGYSDWRVPTMEELETLVRNCNEGECESDIYGAYSLFADVATLWSSTVTRSQTPTNVENYYNVLNFMTATEMELSSEEIQSYYTKIRCVRSEAAAPDPLPECGEGTTPCLDSETELAWSSKFDSMGWEDAVSYCEDLEEAGYTDWRLPTIDEIRTLVQNCEETMAGGLCQISDPNALATTDYGYDSCHCEYISDNGGHYSKLGDDGYFQPWSSSVLSDDATRVWCLDFSSATVDNEYKEYSRPFRCVRSENVPDQLPECSPESGLPCIDTDTGLTWSSLKEDSDEDYLDWQEAFGYCENLEENGYTDWRMPTIEELVTTVTNCPNIEPDGECGDYFYYGGCYCDEPMGSKLGDGDDVMLWSSTIAPEDENDYLSSSYVAGLDFLNDNVTPFLTNGRASVHCVRSDLPVETQRYGTCYGLPEHGSWNSYDLIIQTWNGSEWLPAIPSAFFSENEGETQDCSFQCAADYIWTGSECIFTPCIPNPCYGMENSDGQCTADQQGGYTCGCDANYVWTGVECAATVCITDNPCVGIQNSSGICESSDLESYSCGCNSGFYWTGEQCFVIPECSQTSGTPCTDSASNISWSSKSEDEINFENAGSYCENLTEGGFTDWRLPTIDELRTIIQNCENTQPGGACAVSDPDHLAESDWSEDCYCSWSFQNHGYYSKLGDDDGISLWSSSVFNNTDTAWYVAFGSGEVGTGDADNSVRCVREGQPVIDACIDNPCGAIANSDNSCSTTKLGDYRCGCNDGYFWTGSECAAFPYTDTETNLIWSSKSSVEMNMNSAVEYCENLTEGGYDDWHLPDIDELRTLVQNCASTQTGGSCGVTTDCLEGSCENSCAYCESDSTGEHSKFGETENLWSSSVRSDNSNHAWFINFVRGNVSYGLKSNSYKVRCVREYDPCENNPCQGIANSDGQCSAGEQGGYVCGCTGNHSWNGQACVETLQQLPECSEGTTPCLDTATELAWSSKSEEIEWEDALSYCEDLEEGGYSDWRLPNIDELRTIIRNCPGVQTGGECPASEPDYLSLYDTDEACRCDESMSNIFSDEEEEKALWSSSVVSDDTDYIWFIDFYIYNRDLGYVLWNSVAEARCVRSDNPPAGQEPRQVECTGLPARAVWNNTGTITQTWHLREREWLPSSEGSYNEEASSEECRFKCIDGYTWSGRNCVVITPYTDPETSLTWSAESDSNIDWENAAPYCEDLEEGGYTDWRLPTVDELRTIIQNCEKTQPGGACAISDPDYLASQNYVYDDCRCTEEYPEGYSKLGYGNQYGMLWSSSGKSNNSDYAWAVSFTDGTVFDSLKVNHFRVRCVRSVQQSQADLCDPNPCIGIANSDGACSTGFDGGYSCGCNDGYFWNGEECVSPCDSNPCTDVWNTATDECFAESATEYMCDCDGDYFWDGYSCTNPCEGDPCSSYENSLGNCFVLSATEFECDCDGGDWMGMTAGCVEN